MQGRSRRTVYGAQVSQAAHIYAVLPIVISHCTISASLSSAGTGVSMSRLRRVKRVNDDRAQPPPCQDMVDHVKEVG
jgi:hypothetical protein